MENKRIKIGVQIREDFHEHIRETAHQRKTEISRVLNELLEMAIGKGDPYPYSSTRKLHEMLEDILQQGSHDDVVGITRNIEWGHASLPKRGARRAGS